MCKSFDEIDPRYVYGPLPEVVCLFQLMIKNVINLQTVLLCDGVTAARYLFIFYLKNPFQFQDEFWHTFCNAWVASFALLSQFVFVYSPGHQPLNFFLCVGKNPRCQFHQHFLRAFLVRKSFWQLFLVTFCLWRKICTKNARV
jgi:hypothetical protein